MKEMEMIEMIKAAGIALLLVYIGSVAYFVFIVGEDLWESIKGVLLIFAVATATTLVVNLLFFGVLYLV